MSKTIYEYIKETFGIDVVDYTFKRDYIVNPLVRLKTKGNPKELPYKEDIEYLYLTLNLNIKDLQIIFASSEDLVRKSLEVYKIKKSKNEDCRELFDNNSY